MQQAMRNPRNAQSKPLGCVSIGRYVFHFIRIGSGSDQRFVRIAEVDVREGEIIVKYFRVLDEALKLFSAGTERHHWNIVSRVRVACKTNTPVIRHELAQGTDIFLHYVV